MTYSDDPDDLPDALTDIRAFWCTMELDAQYGLSTTWSPATLMPFKTRQRTIHVLGRNLAHAADRAKHITAWLGRHPDQDFLIRDILKRIANAEAGWRAMLDVLRKTPAGLDPAPRHVIASPEQLPLWIGHLTTSAKTQDDIIADLKLSIERRKARDDEALDHVEWGATDDLEAIDIVLKRSADWPLTPETRAFLAKLSEKARARNRVLINLIAEARPFTTQMLGAARLASLAKAAGEKPN